MFIPYRAKIKITRIPTITIVVAVVCLLVYWAQQRSWDRIATVAKVYCTAEVAAELERPQREIIQSFRDPLTEALFNDLDVPRYRAIERAKRKKGLQAGQRWASAYHRKTI